MNSEKEYQLPFEKIKRNILVKKNAETSPKFGADPKNRPTSELINYGVVNIDKPKGPTSHQISAYTQQMLGISKSGHSGTLDPKVTGVLPMALGRATKVVQALLKAGKEYVCLMYFHQPIAENKIINIFEKFKGRIMQLPPVRSAVKRQLRERNIYYINILEIDGQYVLFKVGCQAGTYIRKLCHDMGMEAGMGAHMAELRRTKAGPFDEDNLVNMYELKDAFWYYKNNGNDKKLRRYLLPVETAVEHLPKIWVIDTSVESICHGANLKIPGIAKLHEGIQKDELVAVMTLKDELIAIGETVMTAPEIMKNERGVVVKIQKVFMLPGIYPTVEKK